MTNPATYDEASDTLTIYGIRYARSLFETLAVGPIDATFRIVGRSDGVVHLQWICEPEPDIERLNADLAEHPLRAMLKS